MRNTLQLSPALFSSSFSLLSFCLGSQRSCLFESIPFSLLFSCSHLSRRKSKSGNDDDEEEEEEEEEDNKEEDKRTHERMNAHAPAFVPRTVSYTHLTLPTKA